MGSCEYRHFELLHFIIVLATPTDDDQQWLKHIKANMYILLLNLFPLLDLSTHSQ